MSFHLQAENTGKVCRSDICIISKGTRENTGQGWTPAELKKTYTGIWYNAKYPAFQLILAKKGRKE